ncbi:MAG: M14 family zinc carboxypeptidase, partial [Thermodesulfobacteriota bacterium]|nr:M14 family zinc carboxypeptidase [Thermodesulfobacteriota bacterium]
MKYLYHSYSETVEFFNQLSREYADYVKVESIGETWEKREIILVTISTNIAVADEKPALFYTGTIHAREYIGVELAIAFARYVVDGMQYDPRIREAFEKSTIYMVPCANPDGLEYSRNHFSFWRKNRRENADGSIGVDLNRNFSVGFKKNNTPSSNVYSGPHPFSEPETCALKEFVDNHENITIALDYHSQGNVFFPAHDFRHENTIDTTDMNVLCANMAEEIRKIAGREYGIHQGKPPATLISGSGREYYYSKGIIGAVVEVGTQNISDYLDTMMEHINEHIPALLVALKEVPNYVKDNPLKRPEGFQLVSVGANEVELHWEYEASPDSVYFEIYRSSKYKAPCNKGNLVAVTKSFSCTDINLESAKQYIYHLRAVDLHSKLKSSFAPGIRVMTTPGQAEMSKTLYPLAAETGYLGENIKNNKSHFGNNSLLTGVNKVKGECIALLTIPLSSMPDNAIVKSACLNLYPINRVSATIEKFGEWKVSIIDSHNVSNIYDFEEIKNAPRITTIGRPTKSQH